MSFYETLTSRCSGIPSTVDFVPYWGARNGSHYWYREIDDNRIDYLCDTGEVPRTGKVYRFTYSRNPIPKHIGKDSIPRFFLNPFHKDVTHLYTKVHDVGFEVGQMKGHKPRYVYLSVFNNLKWEPVAWAQNERGKALFNNLGCNVMFLPTYYRGNKEIALSHPFYISTDGIVHHFKPDTLTVITLSVDRKYPLDVDKIGYSMNLVDCMLQASDSPDFQSPDTLFSVREPSQSMNWVTLDVTTDKAYRYWRLAKKGIITLAEIEFYDRQGREIKGRPFISDTEISDRAFDKNPLTFDYFVCWLGFDFGRPVSVRNVYCLSRTDDNGIDKGDMYELCYYDKGWVSLGTKIAEENQLVFHNVPSNALYWLRNLNSGKEERIFTYDKGRIEFW